MAARFVAILALVTLGHANPVLIGVRDGRAYSIGQAYNYGGGLSTAQANVNGDAAQAYGSAGGDQYARNGYYANPGLALAQAQTDPNFGGAKAVAQAQNGGDYYPVPMPATVITYHQNFEAPAEVAYELPGAVRAQSVATNNGGVGTSQTYATSDGNSVADATAKTQSFGEETESHAKTYGGYGAANSKANTGYGSTRTSAQTQGYGSASSNAVLNGGYVQTVPVVQTNEEIPSVVDVKSVVAQQVVPVQRFASSSSNVVGNGNAASSAKLTGRTISWRFGTLYDKPASSAQAQANTHSGYGAAKSAANTHGHGSANAAADVNNGAYGFAKSNANTHGFGNARSDATANGNGAANAIADVNSGYGAAKSAANTQYGQALSSANTNSQYGAAKSSANLNGGYYGGRTSADAQSQGYGNALSSARTQALETGYKVVNTQANSFGHGSARANAVTA